MNRLFQTVIPTSQPAPVNSHDCIFPPGFSHDNSQAQGYSADNRGGSVRRRCRTMAVGDGRSVARSGS